MDDNKNLNNDKGYNPDGLDSDYIMPVNDDRDKKEDSTFPDYGDDFVLESNEDNSGYAYDIDSEDEYNREGAASGKGPVKKKRAGRNAAIVFTVLAIICLIAAVIFALTQCTGGGKPQAGTTAAATTAAETTAEQTSQASSQEQTQADTTAQQSETQQSSQQQSESSGGWEDSNGSQQAQQSSQAQSSKTQSSQAQSSNASDAENGGSGGTVIEAPDDEGGNTDNGNPDIIPGVGDDLE